MSVLFEPTAIQGLQLRNRLVRSATWEGMCADDGRPTDRLARYYRTLAEGGVGLLISGYTFVRPDGKQLTGKMGIHTDDFADDFQKLTAAVHEVQGAVAIQLVHAGGQTDSRTAGRRPLAPSAVEVAQFPEIPAALEADEIAALVDAFAAAAGRAKAWGFDAVQLHGAHGYLINQFLSPLTNRRTDRYGGPLENRARFLLEVYDAVRSEVGSNYPVLLKLNGSDFLDGGLSLDDAVAAAAMIDQAGIDAIEVSGGTSASGKQSPVRESILKPEQEAYNLPLAEAVKKAVGCPVMTVGGIRSPAMAEEALARGIDFVSLARPLIRQPDLPARWQRGDTAPASCISCNSCFGPGLKGEGISCVIERQEAGQ